MTSLYPNSEAIVDRIVNTINEYGGASITMSVSQGALIIKPAPDNADLYAEIEALKLENIRLRATQCQCPEGGKQ